MMENINVHFRPEGALRCAVSGDLDNLRNSCIASPWQRHNGQWRMFSEPRNHKIRLEATSIDNDKTGLQAS